MGLNWDEIRKKYEETATPEELGQVPKQPKKRAHRRTRTGGTSDSARTPTWNVEEAMQLWLSGETVTTLARKYGKDTDTIRVQFHKDPRYDPKRDVGGSKKRDRCKRGHKYEEVGYFLSGTAGGKSCKKCREILPELRALENTRAIMAEILTVERDIALAELDKLIKEVLDV